jgi:hypothetical protein
MLMETHQISICVSPEKVNEDTLLEDSKLFRSPVRDMDIDVTMDITDPDAAEIQDQVSDSLTNSPSSDSAPLALTEQQVIGPNGQLCQSAEVLEKALLSYMHISGNIFKGGANGRIPTECMICECR